MRNMAGLFSLAAWKTPMPKFDVELVQERVGSVTVEAESAEAAQTKVAAGVDEQIVNWNPGSGISVIDVFEHEE